MINHISTSCFMQRADDYGMFEKITNLSNFQWLLEQFLKDERVTEYRHVANLLAQIKVETGHRFIGVDEIGNRNKYKGRGFLQITGQANYKKFGDFIGYDLVNNPTMANDNRIAYEIVVNALIVKEAPSFTGLKLWKYINENKTDYYNARKCVNSLDKAKTIQKYSTIYHKCFNECFDLFAQDEEIDMDNITNYRSAFR